MFLDYFALFLLFFVAVILFYGVIAIHDIPYEIAKRRNHPQQDALHVAGWISLFTLHAIWPFLWVWATLYREDRGWGFGPTTAPNDANLKETSQERITEFQQSLIQIQGRLQALEVRANIGLISSEKEIESNNATTPNSASSTRHQSEGV